MKRSLASSGVHPDSERRQALFTAFWFVVTRFQILRGYTDHALSKLLVIDSKTVGSWRECIVASGVIQDLIDLNDKLQREQPGICDQARKRSRDSLEKRLTALQKPSSQKLGTRSSGLPAAEAFQRAVDWASQEIFDSYFMDLEDNTTEWTISGKAIPDESIKKIRTLSRQLENDLVELYKSADESDLSWFRAQLEKSISAVATIASKLALQGEIDLMSGFPADTSELAVEMAEKVDAAKKNARAYVAKIYRKMKSDDSISERAAFRGRLELGEGLFQARPTLASDDPMNPYRLAQAERGLVIRLENLIDEIACVRDRKG